MTTQIAETKELDEKLSTLKPKDSLDTLVKGLRKIELTDKILLVLIDSSDSMASPMETQTKIQTAWRLLKDQLAPNLSGWTYGILKFGKDVEWVVMPCSDIRALTLSQTPTTFGGTSMGNALVFSWSWVKSNAKQTRFIMLTDGQANDMPKPSILELAKQNNSIIIDTVGIGQGTWDYDPIFLRQLSNITGGIFCETNTVEMLANTIKSLSPAQRPMIGPVGGKDET